LIDWQQEANPGLGGNLEGIDDSAAAGNKMVAIGTLQDFIQIAWWSGDGRNWTKATLPSGLQYFHLYAVTAVGDSFIAVGESDDSNGNYTAIALTSADGKSWQQLQSATLADWEYLDVAAVGQTIIAVADSTTGAATNNFVTSHDGGQTWSPPADTEGLFAAGSSLALSTTDSDFWAFAQDPEGQGPIAIWRSTNGDTWTSAGKLPDSAGTGNNILAVAHGPLGWVASATATVKHKENFAWWSADGSSWQTSSRPPCGIRNIFADDSGFIAVGYWWPNGRSMDPGDEQGLTFASTDGLQWLQMPTQGWDGKDVGQLRRYNRTLIGIGTDFSGPDFNAEGAVWTAPLPHAADNGTLPPSDGVC